MTERPTQRMEVFQPKKSTMLKDLTPVLLGLISLIGTVVVAYLQFDTSDRVDAGAAKAEQATKATEAKIEVIVEQINTNVIPTMQSTIKELVKENMSLRERIVRLETKLDMAQERSLIHRIMNKDAEPKKIKTSIPKLQVKK